MEKRTNGSFVAIDPDFGKKGLGCACVRVIKCRVSQAFFARPGPGCTDVYLTLNRDIDVVLEKPQIDGRSVNPAVAANVLELSSQGEELAGRIAGRTGRILKRTPTQWKGSQHKPQMWAKAWGELTSDEWEVIARAVGKTPKDVKAFIDRAVRRGWSCRWDPKVSWYPDCPLADLLDALALAIESLNCNWE